MAATASVVIQVMLLKRKLVETCYCFNVSRLCTSECPGTSFDFVEHDCTYVTTILKSGIVRT
jgi:hypothetical protein